MVWRGDKQRPVAQEMARKAMRYDCKTRLLRQGEPSNFRLLSQKQVVEWGVKFVLGSRRIKHSFVEDDWLNIEHLRGLPARRGERTSG